VDLKEEHLLGDQVGAHWYYRAKLAALLRITRKVVPGGVLDVGAGSGFFSRGLLARTHATEATCVDLGYHADRDEVSDEKSLAFRRGLDTSGANLVLMMDVIEHVADDHALIAEYVSKVAVGTRFVISVPAFQWLWSGHDVFLEHYRRYTLPQLERVMAAAGLEVERGHYFYGAVLPLVAAVRFAKRLLRSEAPPGSDMQRHGRLSNAILYAASRAEVRLMSLNRLGGTTVFAMGVKI
jgi:SAM-dependent methyltransferase